MGMDLMSSSSLLDMGTDGRMDLPCGLMHYVQLEILAVECQGIAARER